MIGVQYFKGAEIKTMSAMHDLRAMYEKTLKCTAWVFRNGTDAHGSFQFYPRRARMSDLHVMALAIAVKSACMDSENRLCSKLRTNYRSRFPELIDRTRSLAGDVNCRYASRSLPSGSLWRYELIRATWLLTPCLVLWWRTAENGVSHYVKKTRSMYRGKGTPRWTRNSSLATNCEYSRASTVYSRTCR